MKRRITSEIHQVGGSGFTSPEDAAVYLIQFDGCAALVDAGCGHSAERLIDNVRSCGCDPRRIALLLITHCHYDHIGGARELRRRLGCEIIAHELDALHMEAGDSRVTAADWYGAVMDPLTVDRKLSGPTADIALGRRTVRAVHVPGHSPGSLVYLVESEGKRVLFGQDVHGPLDAGFLSDASAYRASLQRMLSLEADVLCEGHLGVYEGREAVGAFIRSYLPADGGS